AHDSPAMITGEPGTGRGAFARYMHMLSKRSANEPVMLLATSLTDSNAEEQLLGSEANGTVTAGFLERAADSTLIIEELTDLNVAAQKLLIGVLEQGRFLRHGGSKPVQLRARVLATVVDDYDAAVDAGKLRRELVANINVLNLRVPPLREYSEDVPELLSYFVDKLVDSEGLGFRRFSVAAQNRLRNYPWPDNVRELKNLVRRMLMTGSEEEISLDEIEKAITASTRVDEPLVKQDLLALPLREAREQFERAYLQQQLVLCDGKVGKLAKRVGMERTHLYRKLRSLGVDFRSSTTDD
ncbi:MAG: sigma 54-interacting transcriptional regulator, partial [Woeseia sp.]